MKTLKISLFLVLTAVLSTTSLVATAQSWNVETVKYELEENPIPDMENCIKLINTAAEHNKTKTSPKMFYYKGLTYLKVATEYPNLAVQHPDALDIALVSFNKAIENDTKGKYTEDAKNHLLNVAIGFYNIGYNAFQAQDYKAAIEGFNKAIPLMKYDVNGDLKRSNLTEEVLIQMVGYSALGMEDNKMAMKSFQTLIDRGFDDANIYASLAQLQLGEKDTTAALATIAAGKELYETNKTLINLELDLYLKQGRSEELIEKLNNAIETDGANVIYYFARAISYEGLGELEKAEADYDQIIEMDPSYYDAYYNKAVMYTNKVAALVDEINEKVIYDPKELKKYDEKMNAAYSVAIELFEHVFDNNDAMSAAERMELAVTMKKIYAQINRMEDFARMKEWIEANEK